MSSTSRGQSSQGTTKNQRKARNMNPFEKRQQQSGCEKQSGDGNPFAELRAPPGTIEQQRTSGDSISQWSQRCIEADGIHRPAGPLGSTESDNLGTRVANEHLRDSYIAFCTQQGVRPVDPSTFGKACTHMFGRKQRLVPKEWNERRPPAYDVPTAEAWQERLDAMREATPREGPVHRGVGVGIFAGRVKR